MVMEDIGILPVDRLTRVIEDRFVRHIEIVQTTDNANIPNRQNYVRTEEFLVLSIHLHKNATYYKPQRSSPFLSYFLYPVSSTMIMYVK